MSILKRSAKGALVGGSSGSALGAVVGSQFGRAALFAGGTLSGIGAPATIALSVIGGVVGIVAGSAAGATAGGDSKYKSSKNSKK